MRKPNLANWESDSLIAKLLGDSSGHEVDLLSEENGKLRQVEIKSSATLHSSHFDALAWFEKLAGESLVESHLAYAGADSHLRNGVHVHGWKDLANLVV